MFQFPRIFGYVALATEILGAVSSVELLIASNQPLTGAALHAAIEPALQGLKTVVPKFNPPAELVTDIENAAADATNRYVLKKPAPQ